MGKSVAKGSFYDDSYPRKNLYEEEPGGRSLKASKQNMRDLSRCDMTERSHKGSTVVHGAVNGILKPTPVLGNKGITSLLPVFDGSSSRSFVLWLCEVKSCFMKQYLSDSEKCELVVSCLKGYALLWFKTFSVSRLAKGKSMIRSWHKLESHMKKQYGPSCTLEKSGADLHALKQKLLSVNKDTKPCEMTQPMCDKNLEPKPETLEQTELQMACSPTEMNHVSDSCIVSCLSPMENESLIVDHEEDDERLVLTPAKPFKLTKTDLAFTHYKNKDQIPNLSPNEPTLNHLLIQCPAKKINPPCIPKGIYEVSRNERGSMSSKGSLKNLGLLAMSLDRSCVDSWSWAEIMLPMVAWGAMKKIKGEGSHSEIKPTHNKRPRHFLLVFDPGGRNVKTVGKDQNNSLDQARCEKIFFSYNQNLRSNSFEPGEVAAGAKGRGLSFSMPMKQSMELLQGNAKN